MESSLRSSSDFLDFPTLTTARLILRPLTLADTDFVFRHFSDPAVTHDLMDEPPLTDPAQARAIIEFYQAPAGKDHCRWGLARQSDAQLIGTCGYHRWEKAHYRAEIGYDLGAAFWGQGYMREALSAILPYGFERLGLNRVDALVVGGHARSRQLLQRLGFKLEGVLRDYFCRDGKFYDHDLLALLRREWTAGAD